MKKSDAISAFHGVSNLARALKIRPQAVSQWGEIVPELREYQIQKILAAKKHNAQKTSVSVNSD